MNNKILTVIMPVANSEDFIEEAIESVLKSNYEDYYFHIIENGSVDNTKKILSNYINDKIKITYLENSDLVKAMNYGINNSKSKYTAIIDSDDICNSDRFSAQIIFLENNLDHVLVGTSIEYFINQNKTWKIKLPSSNDEINKGFTNLEHSIFNPTIMFRTDVAIKANLFSKNDLPVPDLGFFFRMNTYGKYANLSEIFQLCRLSNSSFTSKNYNTILQKQYELICKNFSKKNIVNQNYLNRMRRNISQKSYMKALKLFLVKKYFNSSLYFIFAGILQPLKAFSYLKTKFNLR